jgi:hypothetical protein
MADQPELVRHNGMYFYFGRSPAPYTNEEVWLRIEYQRRMLKHRGEAERARIDQTLMFLRRALREIRGLPPDGGR